MRRNGRHIFRVLDERARGAFTLIELLVVLAIAAVLLTILFQPDPSAITRRQLDARIQNWRPSEVDAVALSPNLLDPEADILGVWLARRGRHIGSRLEIQKGPSGDYEVKFSTGGCQGHCQLERHAKFQNGVLTLDRPIAEYSTAIYQHLYAARIADANYLVPASSVAAVDAATSSEHSIADERSFDRSVYRRAN